MLDRAEEMQTASERIVPAAQSPGADARRAAWARRPRPGATSSRSLLPDEIASFGSWVEQLIAESTGKEGLGIVPVVGEPLGPPDVYGDDRLFVAIGEHDGLDALENAGHPVVRLALRRTASSSAASSSAGRWRRRSRGYVLGINPFDQPNVQEAKDATKAILAGGHGRGPAVRRPRRAR